MTNYYKQLTLLTSEGYVGLDEAEHLAALLTAIENDEVLQADAALIRSFTRQIVGAGVLNTELAKAFTDAIVLRAGGVAAEDSDALQRVARVLSSVAASRLGTVAGWVAMALKDVVPTGCAITFTHEGLDAFGLSPMAVTGQTVSVTGDGVSSYGMSSGLAGVPVDWVGKRAIESAVSDASFTGVAPHSFIRFVRVSDGQRLEIYRSNTTWKVRLVTSAGSEIKGYLISGVLSDVWALGIDGATGDATVYLNGAPFIGSVYSSGMATSWPQLAGMFSGDSVLIGVEALRLALGDTYSATIRTHGPDFTQTYTDPTIKGWCGEEL